MDRIPRCNNLDLAVGTEMELWTKMQQRWDRHLENSGEPEMGPRCNRLREDDETEDETKMRPTSGPISAPNALRLDPISSSTTQPHIPPLHLNSTSQPYISTLHLHPTSKPISAPRLNRAEPETTSPTR